MSFHTNTQVPCCRQINIPKQNKKKRKQHKTQDRKQVKYQRNFYIHVIEIGSSTFTYPLLPSKLTSSTSVNLSYTTPPPSHPQSPHPTPLPFPRLPTHSLRHKYTDINKHYTHKHTQIHTNAHTHTHTPHCPITHPFPPPPLPLPPPSTQTLTHTHTTSDNSESMTSMPQIRCQEPRPLPRRPDCWGCGHWPGSWGSWGSRAGHCPCCLATGIDRQG